jgi:hypothetical protein
MSGSGTHRQGLPFAIHRYWQAIDYLLALPDDCPAPEAPVPVDLDISDNSYVGKSEHFHNFSHVNYCFGYVSKLHDFNDGCNDFENVNFISHQGTEFYCQDSVCLNSDFVDLNLNFLGNDLHIINSLARERSCCKKYVHIFNINYVKNNFDCGIEFYFNKYWGNISDINVSSSLSVDTSFYQTVCKFYLSDSCSNIVSILARSVSLLDFDLDCCLAGCFSSVISRHVYIDYVKFDLDFIVSRVFAYFNF